jgi:hypothetical protein
MSSFQTLGNLILIYECRCNERIKVLFIIKLEINREINRRPMYEYRCDERRIDKAEGSTRLGYTGLRGGLEHLQIETRLIDERFASVMREW